MAWFTCYEFRRKIIRRFLTEGEHEFLLEVDFTTGNIKCSDINGEINLGFIKDIKITELDGISEIKLSLIEKVDNLTYLKVPVKVKPEKDCGFYLYYNKDATTGLKNEDFKQSGIVKVTIPYIEDKIYLLEINRHLKGIQSAISKNKK